MATNDTSNLAKSIAESSSNGEQEAPNDTPRRREIGGRKEGLEPTRYGDWEKNGRCIDF